MKKTLADFDELNMDVVKINTDNELDDIDDLWYFIRGGLGQWIVGSTGE